ncbi:transposase, MuDR, MULE transposase domain protein, partial [Tanacetum coccineum]
CGAHSFCFKKFLKDGKLEKVVAIIKSCTPNALGDHVKKFLKNGKLEKAVAIIKSCTPYALGDLTVTLKEIFGTISGSIHYKVLTEERFAKTITIGASLILHNVLIMVRLAKAITLIFL